MPKFLSFLVVVCLLFNCKKKDELIIIVDIGHLDRSGLAQQLSIINRCNPKVIGLQFLLTLDSLDKDTLLVRELSKSKNIVQASELHNLIEPLNYWDSLEISHEKFRRGSFGFTTITITEDSIFIPELPMKQHFRDSTIYSFSYLIAEKSFGIKPKYQLDTYRDFFFDRSSINKDFTVISINDLLMEKFSRKELEGKIVLMGHVSDKEYAFYLDDYRSIRISGVEIQASIIRQLLN